MVASFASRPKYPFVGNILLIYDSSLASERAYVCYLEKISAGLREAGNTVVVVSRSGARAELFGSTMFVYCGCVWNGKLYQNARVSANDSSPGFKCGSMCFL